MSAPGGPEQGRTSQSVTRERCRCAGRHESTHVVSLALRGQGQTIDVQQVPSWQAHELADAVLMRRRFGVSDPRPMLIERPAVGSVGSATIVIDPADVAAVILS